MPTPIRSPARTSDSPPEPPVPLRRARSRRRSAHRARNSAPGPRGSSSRLTGLFLAPVFVSLVAAPAAAQSSGNGGEAIDPPSFSEAMPLHEEAIGPFSRPITTDSREAQAYFDQGIQLLYAFAPEEAARSFREAQRRDPGCAVCYWGEAWAWGPYLNGGMDEDDAPRAHQAIQRALELAGSGDPGSSRSRSSASSSSTGEGSSPRKGHDAVTRVERALIEAMSVRYEPTHDEARREALDTVYAEAMGRVFERFPEDLEVGTLYAEALMLLQPRRGRWDLENPAVRRIHEVLEHVLSRDLKHPGACHLYIHATESTTAPEKAEPCAEYLGSAIPGASHINHMPSHTYNRVGRWADGVRANIEAWHSDLKAKQGRAFAIYPSHNLHMLLFAASMAGQGAVAIQAAKDYAKQVEGGIFYRGLTLLRFGRFDEILELPGEEPDDPVFRGLWTFARGYAHLRTGDPAGARAHLEEVRDLAAGEGDAAFRGHPARDLLGIVAGILEGELHREEGRLDEAIAAHERAVELQDGLRYDEPEPLNFAARHWLGAALLEADRAGEAEEVYRRSLEIHPRNGWSLRGLEGALRAQGRGYEAERVRERLEEAWARADTWIETSRF